MFIGGIGSSNLLCSHSSYFTCSTQCHYLKSGLCNFSIYYWFVFPFVARIKLTAKHVYLQYEIMLNKKKLIKMLYSWPMPWTLTEMHHNCTALRMTKMQQQNCKVWYLCSKKQSMGARVQDGVAAVEDKFRQMIGWQMVRQWWIWGIDRYLATKGTSLIPLTMPFWLILAWIIICQEKQVPFYPIYCKRVFLAWSEPPPQPLFPKCSLHLIGRTETHRFPYGFFNKTTPRA